MLNHVVQYTGLTDGMQWRAERPMRGRLFRVDDKKLSMVELCALSILTNAQHCADDLMKFLSLAYGDEKDWKVLTQEEQDALLAHDEMIRKPGEPMAAVQPAVITARAWDGNPET